MGGFCEAWLNNRNKKLLPLPLPLAPALALNPPTLGPTLGPALAAQLKEDLLLSEAVIKINRKGKNQLRMLVITTGAVYNFKTKSARKVG